jgi:hypothetical protein
MFDQIIDALLGITLSQRQIQADANMLRQEIVDLKPTLVPFTKSEMEILSVSMIEKGKRRGFFNVKKGVFNTIFFEPLVAYAYKKYSEHYIVTLIITSDREFLYFIKNKVIIVFFDGQQLGTLDLQGNLYNNRRQLLAKIDGDDHLPTHHVYIRDEDIGFIANPRFEERKTSKRAFNVLKEMTEDETTIFLALTLINLVEESL